MIIEISLFTYKNNACHIQIKIEVYNVETTVLNSASKLLIPEIRDIIKAMEYCVHVPLLWNH